MKEGCERREETQIHICDENEQEKTSDPLIPPDHRKHNWGISLDCVYVVFA